MRRAARSTEEAIAEALHAAALVVHRHQQWRGRAARGYPPPAHPAVQGVLVIAGKEDDAAHQRMAQHFTVFRRQALACDIDHQRSQSHALNFPSVRAAGRRTPRGWCAEIISTIPADCRCETVLGYQNSEGRARSCPDGRTHRRGALARAAPVPASTSSAPRARGIYEYMRVTARPASCRATFGGGLAPPGFATWKERHWQRHCVRHWHSARAMRPASPLDAHRATRTEVASGRGEIAQAAKLVQHRWTARSTCSSSSTRSISSRFMSPLTWMKSAGSKAKLQFHTAGSSLEQFRPVPMQCFELVGDDPPATGCARACCARSRAVVRDPPQLGGCNTRMTSTVEVVAHRGLDLRNAIRHGKRGDQLAELTYQQPHLGPQHGAVAQRPQRSC